MEPAAGARGQYRRRRAPRPGRLGGVGTAVTAGRLPCRGPAAPKLGSMVRFRCSAGRPSPARGGGWVPPPSLGGCRAARTPASPEAALEASRPRRTEYRRQSTGGSRIWSVPQSRRRTQDSLPAAANFLNDTRAPSLCCGAQLFRVNDLRGFHPHREPITSRPRRLPPPHNF